MVTQTLLKFCISLFLILLTYDTVNFFLNNEQQRNPLLVVRRDVEAPYKAKLRLVKQTIDWTGLQLSCAAASLAAFLLILVGALLIRKRSAEPGAARVRPKSRASVSRQAKNYDKTRSQVQEEDDGASSAVDSSSPSSLYENVSSQNVIHAIKVKNTFTEKADEIIKKKEVLAPEVPDDRVYPAPVEAFNVTCEYSLFPNLQAGDLPAKEPEPQVKKEDLEKLEKSQEEMQCRLECLEEQGQCWNERITSLEEATKRFDQRFGSTEGEIGDLHEQVYTVLKKFEEERQQNCIITSITTEASLIEHENIGDMFNFDSSLSKYINQGFTSEEWTGMRMTEDEKGMSESRYTKEVIFRLDDEEVEERPRSKSVGMEARLDDSHLCKPRRRRQAEARVPGHVVQPYKRSTSISTDPHTASRPRRSKKT